jgi:Xaa-Pro dipeptidase
MMQTTQARLNRVREIARRASLDGVAFVPGANLFYLTGASFHLMERPTILLVLPEGDPAMIIPSFEVSKIAGDPPFPIRYFTYTDAEGHLPAFEQIARALALAGKRIGVEGFKMRILEGKLFQRLGCQVNSADDAIAALRIKKDAAEIAAMRKAIAVSEIALEATVREVRPGMTERQIASLLLNALSDAGGEGNADEPIVLGGPNSAVPHGGPTDRPVQLGEILLFDFGATSNSYPADITRSFMVGEPDAESVRIYETVLAANEAGIRAAGLGVPAHAIDRAARRVIADAGYGEFFIHRTGHGLGLDGHEEPYIREGNPQVLEPGMVFTVEPGIYIPGKGGVRIEDNVLVTEHGVEVLTSYPKDMRIIGQ